MERLRSVVICMVLLSVAILSSSNTNTNTHRHLQKSGIARAHEWTHVNVEAEMQSEETILGSGVFLPGVDILDCLMPGRKIFGSNLSSVVITQDYPQMDLNDYFYSSSVQLLTSVAQNAGIYTGSIPTLSLSLNETLESLKGSMTMSNISGLFVNSISYSKIKQLSVERLTSVPLNPDLLEDLAELPMTVVKSWESSSWEPFKHFLNKWGTHYISKVYTGSLLQQWSAAETRMNYTKLQFRAQACLQLEGIQSMNAISACEGISMEEKMNSTRYTMTNKLTVLGGDPITRTKLSITRTDELVQQFMLEGATSEFPIQYQFDPIWQLIAQSYDVGSEDWQRAKNLEAYYEGYLGFSCPLHVTANGLNMQYFKQVDDSYGSHFECRRLCKGCQEDHDCHIGGPIGNCYCHGDSCIVLDMNNRPMVRRDKKGSYNDDINRSCRHDWWCKCFMNQESDCPNGFYVQWSQSNLLSLNPRRHAPPPQASTSSI